MQPNKCLKDMKENTVQTYLDGVVVRMHNKRITVKDYVNDENGGALIQITVARKELPTEDKPQPPKP